MESFQELKFLLFVGLFFILSGVASYGELRYRILGRTTEATITSVVEKDGSRTGNPKRTLEYRFVEESGTVRTETYDVAADFVVPAPDDGNSSSKITKGGRRFSFTAMVVTGDRNGRVGWGYGKATEVPNAVEKATKVANRSLVKIPIVEGTIPHQVKGRFRSSEVLLLPARPGTGIIAGGAVRAVVESAGITDILTKSFGSNNPMNLVKAVFEGLQRLRTREEVERLRGVEL